MSVLVKDRRESPFEVIHHFYKMRREITDLLLRDFGYSKEKEVKKYRGRFGGKCYEELNDSQKSEYERFEIRSHAFDEWFIGDERDAVMRCLRNINRELTMANSIYPCYQSELIERRLHQDRALGECYTLEQELQYAMETLPVDINKYLRFAQSLDREIHLIKEWRKSDNRFKKLVKS